ncbi:MAG: phytoene/squalene synthase family protein [Gammaproteobacteria bacterium]
MDERIDQGQVATDEAFQDFILQGVSRTFALTIPQLPSSLSRVVGNAYLLCRIADTIEDEPALDWEKKCQFAQEFARVVAAKSSASRFAVALHSQLSDATLPAERELVSNTARVIRLTHGFNDVQRSALQRCVQIMASGMAEFQQNKTLAGLPNLRQLDRYCYYVAGVVGEMLTELFCDHLTEMREHREHLSRLAVSFGQGLQMTNILKDIWEDRQRGACWLPRDVFLRAGFDLKDLSPDHYSNAFGRGLDELIGIARMHLLNALTYTLHFPRGEKGIRRFCLWAVGMAVLTLRNISKHPDFRTGRQVKISRRAVQGTVLVTSLAVSNDVILRGIFQLYTRRLPAASSPMGLPTPGY